MKKAEDVEGFSSPGVFRFIKKRYGDAIEN